MAYFSPTPAFSAASGLKGAAIFGATGLFLSALHAVAGVGIPCPWRALTHTLCPLCGATTMGSALLRGDIAAAWAANQLVFVGLCVLAIACGCWLWELVGGPRLRLPARLAEARWWYAAFTAVGLGFMVIRNLAG